MKSSLGALASRKEAGEGSARPGGGGGGAGERKLAGAVRGWIEKMI